MRTFVIYTTAVGGTYRAARATREEYDEAVKSGLWMVTNQDDSWVDIKMIGFLECDEYHDFVLERTFAPFA